MNNFFEYFITSQQVGMNGIAITVRVINVFIHRVNNNQARAKSVKNRSD